MNWLIAYTYSLGKIDETVTRNIVIRCKGFPSRNTIMDALPRHAVLGTPAILAIIEVPEDWE